MSTVTLKFIHKHSYKTSLSVLASPKSHSDVGDNLTFSGNPNYLMQDTQIQTPESPSNLTIKLLQGAVGT